MKSLNVWAALPATLLLFACVSGSDNSSGIDRDLIPVEIEGKLGYVNSEGKYMILPSDGFCSSFSDGYAVKYAETSDKVLYGLADKKGKFVIQPEYTDLIIPSEGIVWALKDKDDIVALDLKGNTIFTLPEADWVFSFSEGLAKFSGANEAGERVYGFVDMKGDIAIPATLHDANSFTDGFAAVQGDDHRWYYIDKKGKNAFGTQTWSLASDFHNGRASVKIDGETPTTGIIDKEGKLLFSMPGLLEVDGNGYTYRNNEHRYGWINDKGVITIDPQFDYLGRFCDNELAPIRVGGKYGYADRSGRIVLNPQWDDATMFVDNEFAFVETGGKYGMIDRKGNYIANPQWDDVSSTYVYAMNGFQPEVDLRSKNFFGTCPAVIVRNFVKEGKINGWDLTWTAEAIAEKIGMTKYMYSRIGEEHILQKVKIGNRRYEVFASIYLRGKFFKKQSEHALSPIDYIDGVKPESVMIQFWEEDYKKAFNDQWFNRLVKELGFELNGSETFPYATGKIGKYPARLMLYDVSSSDRHGVQLEFGNNLKAPHLVDENASSEQAADDEMEVSTDADEDYAEDSTFHGKVGDYPVVMELTFSGYGDKMTGRYRYTSKNQWIDLVGTYIDGVMELDEKVNGNITGHFSFAMSDNGSLSGVWTNSNKTKTLKFQAVNE